MIPALLLLVPLAASPAETGFINRGFDHHYNLEYDEAIADFERAVQADPQDPGPHNDIIEAMLYREMFRNGALESELVSGNNSFLRRPKLNPAPEVEKRFLNEVQKAMSLAQARINRNSKDIPGLYALGVTNALKANYDYLVRKAWRDSLSEATAARKLHNQVTEIDPSYTDARLIQAVHEYLVGNLPWYYRSLGLLVGFRGDRELGLRTLEEVAAKGKADQVDAQILLCAFYRRENKPRKALPLVEDLIRRYPRNFLFRLEQAQMYSAIGDKKKALETMEMVAALKRSSAPGYAHLPWEKIYYQVGNIQFWYNDLDQALLNLKKVTDSPQELDLNTGVLAFMRQGQIYDMTNRHPLAIQEYNKAIAFAPQADAAKESRRYIAVPYKRESL